MTESQQSLSEVMGIFHKVSHLNLYYILKKNIYSQSEHLFSPLDDKMRKDTQWKRINTILQKVNKSTKGALKAIVLSKLKQQAN